MRFGYIRGMTQTTYPTVEQIAAKRAAGDTLTVWERSVYLLNYRDDGTRYSTDPKVREAQYDEDIAKQYSRKG